jgi:hypothetical protein
MAGDTAETLHYAWVDQTFRAKEQETSAKPLRNGNGPRCCKGRG